MIKRLTAKRKTKLLEEYGDSVRPITQKQIEWCLRDTARYIWFVDHDANHGYCERCGNDVTFEKKTRHKKKIVCPHCKKELEARHKWRVSTTWNVDFRVITKIYNDTEVFMRYILIEQRHSGAKYVREVAREVMNFAIEDRRQLEKTDHGWDIGDKQRWFKEIYMWNYRKYCCLQADPYIPGFNAELKKLDRVKYLDNPLEYNNNMWYVTAFIRELYKRSDLYEKLEKIGLKDLAINDFVENCNSWNPKKIRYNNDETKLTKMLGLNKQDLKRFIKYKSTAVLNLLQNHMDVSDREMEVIAKYHIDSCDFGMIKDLDTGHRLKTLKYIGEQKIEASEYSHYIDLLKKLNYKLDSAYLYPKDFRKEDLRVAQEYKEMMDKRAQEEKAKQSYLIQQISYGLKAMDNIQEFLNGSKGLLVCVPESREDLERESKKLHNCLSSYSDRIAEMKTMVFFIRRPEAPNEPFIAMEYCNGEVVQCRYDYNKPVEDAKILDFVDAFADRLRERKVLVA